MAVFGSDGRWYEDTLAGRGSLSKAQIAVLLRYRIRIVC